MALVQNTASSSEVRKAKKQYRQTEAQKRADLRELMPLPAFQRFVRELLAWCHPYATSFDLDGQVMAFKEGERNIALRLIQELERANPSVFYTHVLLPGVHERVAEERKAEQTHGES